MNMEPLTSDTLKTVGGGRPLDNRKGNENVCLLLQGK